MKTPNATHYILRTAINQNLRDVQLVKHHGRTLFKVRSSKGLGSSVRSCCEFCFTTMTQNLARHEFVARDFVEHSNLPRQNSQISLFEMMLHQRFNSNAHQALMIVALEIRRFWLGPNLLSSTAHNSEEEEDILHPFQGLVFGPLSAPRRAAIHITCFAHAAQYAPRRRRLPLPCLK